MNATIYGVFSQDGLPFVELLNRERRFETEDELLACCRLFCGPEFKSDIILIVDREDHCFIKTRAEILA